MQHLDPKHAHHSATVTQNQIILSRTLQFHQLPFIKTEGSKLVQTLEDIKLWAAWWGVCSTHSEVLLYLQHVSPSQCPMWVTVRLMNRGGWQTHGGVVTARLGEDGRGTDGGLMWAVEHERWDTPQTDTPRQTEPRSRGAMRCYEGRSLGGRVGWGVSVNWTDVSVK